MQLRSGSGVSARAHSACGSTNETSTKLSPYFNEEIRMKTLLGIVTAAALALGAAGALAQSKDASTTDAQRPTSKEAMDAQMELQKNKPSKPVDKSKPKHRPGGQAGMESQMNLQANKPSKPVDKNAKAAEPRPNASKMTPEERAAFRKDVVKEAKP
jgi:hypothetical protein